METLWGLVPISADSLRCELDLLRSLVHDLAEAEVGDLDLAVVEDDVLWFEVKVDYLLLALVQVLQATQNLGNNQLGFFLWYLFILLEIEV